MNIRAVCAVVVAALAARKLVDVLEMIRAGFSGISYHDLPVLVPEPDCGSVYAFSRHASNHTPNRAELSGNRSSIVLSSEYPIRRMLYLFAFLSLVLKNMSVLFCNRGTGVIHQRNTLVKVGLSDVDRVPNLIAVRLDFILALNVYQSVMVCNDIP